MMAGLHDGALKLKLTAPPVDNAANLMCLKFLAKSLQVSKSALTIISGRNSRHKHILLRFDHAEPSPDAYQYLKHQIEKLVSS
jgi:uncharacterized protein YggU (UPF0235/DUF167 family)